RVASVQSPDDLAAAGVADAQAVICADDDDDLNLEIALLARQANPTVRVVARLANSVLRTAVAGDNGAGAILDVADLAAPSVVGPGLPRPRSPLRPQAPTSSSPGLLCRGTAHCGTYTAISHRSR